MAGLALEGQSDGIAPPMGSLRAAGLVLVLVLERRGVPRQPRRRHAAIISAASVRTAIKTQRIISFGPAPRPDALIVLPPLHTHETTPPRSDKQGSRGRRRFAVRRRPRAQSMLEA